jgi:hypothetical protein
MVSQDVSLLTADQAQTPFILTPILSDPAALGTVLLIGLMEKSLQTSSGVKLILKLRI